MPNCSRQVAKGHRPPVTGHAEFGLTAGGYFRNLATGFFLLQEYNDLCLSCKLEENDILGEGMSFTANEKKTAEKTSYNINNFYGSVQSPQIQQAAVNATQMSSLYQFDSDMVKKILDEVKNHIKDLNVGSDTEQELEAEIQTVEVQIKSPKPKYGIIKESLMSIRKILEGAGGSIAAQLLLQLGSLF